MSWNKKKNRVSFLYKFFSIVLGIVALILCGFIFYLNILSIPLLILVIFVIAVLCYISIFLVLKSKMKNIGLAMILILIVLFGVLIFYINMTTGFLGNLNLTYKTYNYSVVVKNNTYSNIKDIKGSLGYLDDNSAWGSEALNKVEDKIGLDGISYQDSYTLINALLNNEVQAVLIENSYLNILNEDNSLDGKLLEEKIDKIYDFKVVINTSDMADDIDVTRKPFNIYVSGIDAYGEISSVSRSDVNMVISVNPMTKQILLTSIPRDYYVKLPGKKGYNDKLTHAGLYGIDMSISTVESLLGCDINYYVKVNFSSVIDIVNALGGIEVYSDYTFKSLDNYSYNKGYNKINGKAALSFVRERKAFPTGDRQRVKNQQAVFKAILDKCMSKEIISKYSDLLDSLEKSFVTNMPMSRMMSLVKMQLSKNYEWNIVTNSLEGSDSKNFTFSAPTQKSYVMLALDSSILYSSKLIDKVSSGAVIDAKLMKEIKNDIILDDNKDMTVNGYEDNKFKVKLIRSSVTLDDGEEYVYHGYVAIYDGVDVTGNKNIDESFSINGKKYDNYLDLVWYISTELDSGNYVVNYEIGYKGEVVKLKQKVIKE